MKFSVTIMVDTILSAMMIIIILRIEKAIQTTTSGIIQKHNLKNDRTTSKHTCENEWYRCGMKEHWSCTYHT